MDYTYLDPQEVRWDHPTSFSHSYAASLLSPIIQKLRQFVSGLGLPLPPGSEATLEGLVMTSQAGSLPVLFVEYELEGSCADLPGAKMLHHPSVGGINPSTIAINLGAVEGTAKITFELQDRAYRNTTYHPCSVDEDDGAFRNFLFGYKLWVQLDMEARVLTGTITSTYRMQLTNDLQWAYTTCCIGAEKKLMLADRLPRGSIHEKQDVSG